MSNSATKTIIVDSDALIALFNQDDANFNQAKLLFEECFIQKVQLIYPATVLVETIDTLQRKLKKHETAQKLASLVSTAQFAQDSIEAIDGVCIKEAVNYFGLKEQTRNTLADAVVATVAKKHQTEWIFSFDQWYQKIGFKLITKVN